MQNYILIAGNLCWESNVPYIHYRLQITLMDEFAIPVIVVFVDAGHAELLLHSFSCYFRF